MQKENPVDPEDSYNELTQLSLNFNLKIQT